MHENTTPNNTELSFGSRINFVITEIANISKSKIIGERNKSAFFIVIV